MTADLKLVEALVAHSLSTSNESCCSCGAWFIPDFGPIDIQHPEHIAAIIEPLIEARERVAWEEGEAAGRWNRDHEAISRVTVADVFAERSARHWRLDGETQALDGDGSTS